MIRKRSDGKAGTEFTPRTCYVLSLIYVAAASYITFDTDTSVMLRIVCGTGSVAGAMYMLYSALTR